MSQLTSFVQGELLTPTRALVFVEISNGVAELVKDNTPLLARDTRPIVNPTKVHGGLCPRNGQSALPHVRPRSVVTLECDTDVGIRAVRDELELEIGYSLPLLDDLLDFGSLSGSARYRVDEADSESLSFRRMEDMVQVVSVAENYEQTHSIPFRSPIRETPSRGSPSCHQYEPHRWAGRH